MVHCEPSSGAISDAESSTVSNMSHIQILHCLGSDVQILESSILAELTGSLPGGTASKGLTDAPQTGMYQQAQKESSMLAYSCI